MEQVGVRAVIEGLSAYLTGLSQMDRAQAQLGVSGGKAGTQIGHGMDAAAAAGKRASGVFGALGGVLDGLGKVGLAAMGVQAVASGVKGLGDALGVGLNVELENTRAQLVAFTKDGAAADKILAQIREEANRTPFAFQEMAKAAASLMPVAKQSGAALMDLVKQAEILAASNPAQGLEGAAFALREAAGGDFVSIIERFNLSRQTLNKLKDEGVPALQAVTIAMKEMGFDADLVSGLANTASGRWSTFMDTVDTLRATLSKPLFDVASAGLASLQARLDANMPALQDFAATAGKTLGTVAQAAGALVSGAGFQSLYEQMIAVWGPEMARTVAAFLDPVAKARVALGALVSGDITGGLESLRVAGSQAVESLQSGFNDVVSWLGANTPALAEQLAGWATALVAWVGPQIPVLLNQMQDFREAALAWIVAQVPGWIETLGSWGLALVEWVAPMIPPALVELGKFLTRTLEWLTAAAPGLAERFIGEWVPAATGWVGKAAVALAGELPEILGTIANWILLEGVPRLITLAAHLGVAIVKGLIEGSKTMYSALFTSMTDMAKGALQAAKDFLGVKSPSTAFAEVGAAIVDGMILGVQSRETALIAAIEAIAAAAWDRAAAVNDARMAVEMGKLAQMQTADFDAIRQGESKNSQIAWSMTQLTGDALARHNQAILAGAGLGVAGNAAELAARAAAAQQDMILRGAALAIRDLMKLGPDAVIETFDEETGRSLRTISAQFAVDEVLDRLRRVFGEIGALTRVAALGLTPGAGFSFLGSSAAALADMAFLFGGGAGGRIPGFAAGGMVPGALGMPTLALLHGGEQVVSPFGPLPGMVSLPAGMGAGGAVDRSVSISMSANYSTMQPEGAVRYDLERMGMLAGI